MTNDLADWFPILREAGVAVPETRIVKTDCDLIELLDGKTPKGYDDFLAELRAACIGLPLPLFLRSGQTSAKHGWRATCYLRSLSDLSSHISRIVEYGECASFFGLPYGTWVVRELLKTEPAFYSFAGMPITKERRYFIESGEVKCHHPYWPEDAFEDQINSSIDWRERLAGINRESESEIADLSELSRKVSRSFDGAWSLDWLMTSRGWVAIDMAQADGSWHWPDCQKILLDTPATKS